MRAIRSHVGGRLAMEKQQPLIPVFIPALAPLLLRAEQIKGAPLEREEVLETRDQAQCIMMRVEDAQALEEKRGYRDLNPEQCWEEWKQFRSELLGGETADDEVLPVTESPPAEPRDEPLFMALDTNDPDYLQTIDYARGSLDEFRRRIEACRTSRNVPCIKARIEGGGRLAYLWLADPRPDGDHCTPEGSPPPGPLPALRLGDATCRPTPEP